MINYLKYSAVLAAWTVGEAQKALDAGRKLLFVNDDEKLFIVQHKALCAYAVGYLDNFIDYRNTQFFDYAGDGICKKLTADPLSGVKMQQTNNVKLCYTNDGRRRIEQRYCEFIGADGLTVYVLMELLKPLDVYKKRSRYIDAEYYYYNNILYVTFSDETVAVFAVTKRSES